MSVCVPRSLFFLVLPERQNLVCVSLSLREEEEVRSRQIKTCRELVLLYSDILASPALDSFTDITVVMAVPFFQTGVLQVFGQRRSLQVSRPHAVSPGVLQCCLSYSLITRLSPSWNKAGLYLITGKDFLSESGRLNAVSMELSTSEGQLCISVEASTVRLPPTTLQDLDLPPLVLRRFCSDPDAVLDPSSTGGAVWCHVLPSMKKGQIITITHTLPRDGPFRSYAQLRSHWSSLYGYRLPELAEEEEVYCSVYFRLVGERLFTYPLSCVRLQPVQRCPRVDLQGALGSFLSDIGDKLRSVCGFPARLTAKPRYPSVSLSSAATVQVLRGEQVNLNTTSSSSSIRPVLTQLPPPPPPPPPPRPVQLFFGSQPPASAPLSAQDGAQGLLGNGCGFGGRLTQSQGCRGDVDAPSSSKRVSFSFSDSPGPQSAPPPSSSSSSLHPFQPASSLSSPSPVLPPLPPPSQTPVIPPPKLVPIFKNKCPSRHVNVALLRAQKQREQLGAGGEERARVTLPAFVRKTPAATASSSSSSSLSAATLIVPRFNRRPKLPSSSAPPPTDRPKLKHIPSLSPASKSKPLFVVTPKPEIKSKPPFVQTPKPEIKSKPEPGSGGNAGGEVQERARKPPSAAPPEPPRPLTPSDKDACSSTEGVLFASKPKKSRSAIRDVDVEQMARNNQLSQLNSATLVSWLRGRGVHVSAKHRKQEVMLKVMACLAEA